MAVGDIIRTEGLMLMQVTVKANEDIELGEMVVDDGNGFLAATAALAALSKPMVALEAHDYSEASVHTITVGVKGVFEVQKTANNGAIRKGNKLTIDSTAGEVKVFSMADVTSTVNETNVENAMLANQAAFGQAYEDVATGATSVKIIL
jgi:hypothetical protein